jgi:NADH-quinone oxidoreductase subunit L
MPDLFGPVTRASLAFGLWVVPFAPLLAAAYVAIVPLWRAVTKKPRPNRDGRGTTDEAAAGNVALLAAGVSFGWAAWSTLRLSQLEDGQRFLLEHVLRMLRVGQLDVALDLALDGMSAAILLAVSAGALVLFATMRARATPPATLAWASLLLASTQLSILADGLGVVLVGWGVAACAVLGLTRDVRGFVAARATDAVMAFGTIALFWGLGGSWSESDYLPDLSPRFAAVRVAAAPDADDARDARDAKDGKRGHDDDAEERRRDAAAQAQAQAGGKGLLTMTAYPGALVFMDDARVPLMNGDAPLRAPFSRYPVPSGLHSFRVHPGSGLDDYLVSHVSLGKDREIALGVFGATVTFAQMRDQLLVKDAHGEASARTMLLSRKLEPGLSLVTAACLLLFVGAAGRSAQAPLHGALVRASAGPPVIAALVAGTATVLGAHLVLRLHILTQLSGVASAVIALAGGGSAVLCAWQAVRATDLRRIVAYLTAADLGFAMLGAGTGAHAAATLALATSVLSGGAAWACVIALEGGVGTDIRRMGGLAKSAPTVARVWFITAGASWIASVPKLAVLIAAFGTLATAKVPGWLLFVLGVTAMGLGAHATHRVFLVVFEGKPGASAAKEPDATARASAWALTGVATVAGAVLGLGGRFVGKSGPSVFDEWMEDVVGAAQVPSAPTSAGVTWGLLLVAIGAAVAGWRSAQIRFGAGRPRAKELEIPPPEAESTLPEAPRTPGTPAMATVAVGVERWILDGAHAALGVASRAAALLVATADDKLLGAPIDSLADRSARLEPRARATVAAAFVLVAALVLYLALRKAP